MLGFVSPSELNCTSRRELAPQKPVGPCISPTDKAEGQPSIPAPVASRGHGFPVCNWAKIMECMCRYHRGRPVWGAPRSPKTHTISLL